MSLYVGNPGLGVEDTETKDFVPDFKSSPSRNKYSGNSLVVSWLELCVFTAEGPDSILGQGTKTPRATWHGKKNKNKNKKPPLFKTDVIPSFFLSLIHSFIH